MAKLTGGSTGGERRRGGVPAEGGGGGRAASGGASAAHRGAGGASAELQHCLKKTYGNRRWLVEEARGRIHNPYLTRAPSSQTRSIAVACALALGGIETAPPIRSLALALGRIDIAATSSSSIVRRQPAPALCAPGGLRLRCW